ncbi:MAG TPA: glycosyltransferase family 1 protein [Isosphaeraceae bacterium]|jgi:glycosyltransferase involved in cell wall biosynthesis|nr:glycosyltransferase family 1 protein [Isosphaeraceae bacterium]
MRVTLITETFFPQVNGVSRTLGQLARVLTEAGDAVQLIHPDYGVPTRGRSDVAVRSIRVPFYPELHLPVPPFRRMAQGIDAFEPDIIHIATEATLGLAALRFARKRRIPTVSSFHTNFDQYSAHYRVAFARGAIRSYLRWFHNQTLETYVPSQSTIANLESLGFRNLVLWPRGVDGTMFRPDRPGRATVREALGFRPDDVVIGHVSRIAAEKNVTYLGEALAQVSASRPEVRILIVGDGPERPALAKRLGPAAQFAGYRTGDDLADHFAAADLFAFASLTETFGNVILEAMASGLPVVAVRAGGPGNTVLDGRTGALVEPDQPPERFAEAIIRLVDDGLSRRKMAAQARAYALSQTWDRIMTDLRGRYEEIVASAAARHFPRTMNHRVGEASVRP